MCFKSADCVLGFARTSSCEYYGERFRFWVGGEELVGQTAADRESETAAVGLKLV